MIGSLLSLPGVNATRSELGLICVTLVTDGAPGAVAATKLSEGADSDPSPTPLVAWTVHVYESPVTSEPTVSDMPAPDTGAGWSPAESHVTA